MQMTMDRWTVQDLTLSPEKLEHLWRMLRRQRTLFSDLTAGDVSNFMATITSPNSVWFEVRDHGTIVGFIFFDDLHLVTDCTAHMVFLDRNILEKKDLCMAVVRHMFDNFPLERMSVTPPKMYKKTVNFLRVAGFKEEGTRRRASLIGGRWWDQSLFGITREEVQAL